MFRHNQASVTTVNRHIFITLMLSCDFLPSPIQLRLVHIGNCNTSYWKSLESDRLSISRAFTSNRTTTRVNYLSLRIPFFPYICGWAFVMTDDPKFCEAEE